MKQLFKKTNMSITYLLHKKVMFEVFWQIFHKKIACTTDITKTCIHSMES